MKEHEVLRATEEYSADCKAKHTTPHVNELAARLDMPVSKLSNYFLGVVGVRPSVYLKRKHVRDAIYLIKTTALDYTTVARITGYGSRTTLFRSIRRVTGRTPESFRRRKLRREK